MNRLQLPKDWLHHVVPLSVTLVALAAIVLTPVWALAWARQPFLGLFLEPNNVVSQLENADWPARAAGVQSYDRLVRVEQQPVSHASGLANYLQQGNFEPVRLGFEQRDGSAYEVMVAPRAFRSGELVRWFGVPYAVGLAFLGIGLWTYRMSREQRPARAFLSFTAAFSLTTSLYFDMNTSQHFVLGWALSIPVAAAALAHLALVFPRPMAFVQNRPTLRWLPWGVAILLSIPVAREILWPSNPWGYISTWFIGYAFSALAIVLFLGSLLVRVFRDTSATIRQQSRLIVFGAALAFGPILFLFLLPSAMGQLVRFPVSIAFPAMAVLPLSVAYSIVRYRMLDVDRFLGATLSYAITASGAVLLFYLVLALVSLLIPAEVTPDDPLTMALYLFLLVVITNPIRTSISKVIDRIFYRTRADYRRVLMHLSQELVISPEMDRTLNLLAQEIGAALEPEGGALYLFDDDEAIFRPHRTMGNAGEIIIAAENPLIVLLNRYPRAFWFPPERPLPAELAGQADMFEALRCRLFVPLRYEGRLTGFFALGARRSGDPYTSDDLNFLDAVASQSSLALENVRLFANLQDTLAETLEMKNLMDDIFQSMSSGVITTDVQRKITLFNQAAERILGASLDQVMGQPIGEALAALGPQFSVITNATIENSAATLGEELSPTVPARGPLTLRLSWTPLKDAQQSTKGATIVIDDLTEQRHLEAERERIRQTFGRVVAPRVRDRLLEDPGALRLDGIRQPLTVLFADIHQFTPFSERTQVENLFEILNSYLSLAAQAVLEEEGTLDKFMGDAVMAFWNAPDCQADHTFRAARAALKMTWTIQRHRTNMSAEHQLFFSIGINVGDAMVGNVGTTDLFNYTAIGDTVNYAQRLESIAAPGQILLSQAAYQTIAGQVLARALPPVQVKGRSEAAVVYELLGLK